MRNYYLYVFFVGLLIHLHPGYADAITLGAAMTKAAEQHPAMHMAENRIEAANGNLIEQASYAYNPELALEPQRRQLNAGGRSNDYYITLSQGIEIGGKRGYREQSAQAALDAVRQDGEATRQQLAVEAARAFIELHFAQQSLALRSQQNEMLHKLNQAVGRQVELGQSSQLDANLAQSVYVSALNAQTSAQQALSLSRMRYFSSLGQMGEAEKTLHLELPALLPDWRPPEDAITLALASRHDFSALRSRLDQSTAMADLANAERIPDVTFSAMAGREAREKLVKFGVTIPFPVLNSHKGAYQAALARAEQARTGLVWSEQQLRYEVRSALDNHATAMHALSGMSGTEMQQAGQETISLARMAYAAGELDLEELVVHMRQGLDARLTALEMTRQGWRARIRLAEVLGHPEYILEGTKP